jgi:hypothetical protein
VPQWREDELLNSGCFRSFLHKYFLGMRVKLPVLLFLLTALHLAMACHAQESPGKSTITPELFGVGQGFSINYGRVLKQRQHGFISGRLGLGVEGFGFPLLVHGITYCWGKDKHYFESGLLGTLGPTSLGFADASSAFYVAAPMVGYRRHPVKGLTFTFYISTLIPVDEFIDIAVRPGIGLGYAFGKPKQKNP